MYIFFKYRQYPAAEKNLEIKSYRSDRLCFNISCFLYISYLLSLKSDALTSSV